MRAALLLGCLLLAFIRLNAQTAPQVQGCVWWFDDGPADTLYFSNPPTGLLQGELELPTDTLRPGTHTLHLRFFDGLRGAVRWTGVVDQLFVQPSTEAPDQNVMRSFRYWFDAQPDDIIDFPLFPETVLNETELPYPTDRLPVDTLVLYHQFRDARGQWSSVAGHAFFNSTRPVADFELLAEPPCANQVMRFRSQTTFVRDFYWDFGDGSTSTQPHPVHTYTEPGNYTVTLRASNPVFADSVVSRTRQYTLRPSTRSVYTPFGDTAICTGRGLVFFAEARGPEYGYAWLRNGDSVATGALFRATEAGRYQLVLRNAEGCRDTARASILELIPPQTPRIRRGGGDSLIVEPGGLAYQWFVDGEAIPEATGRVLRTHFDGRYTVRLVDSCGFGAQSDEVEFSYVGRRAGASGAVWLYPNPARGGGWLRAGGGTWHNLRVFSATGQLVEQRDLRTLDLSRPVAVGGQLPAGLYIIELQGSDKSLRLRWLLVE